MGIIDQGRIGGYAEYSGQCAGYETSEAGHGGQTCAHEPWTCHLVGTFDCHKGCDALRNGAVEGYALVGGVDSIGGDGSHHVGHLRGGDLERGQLGILVDGCGSVVVEVPSRLGYDVLGIGVAAGSQQIPVERVVEDGSGSHHVDDISYHEVPFSVGIALRLNGADHSDALGADRDMWLLRLAAATFVLAA